jgi:hypothetical protein
MRIMAYVFKNDEWAENPIEIADTHVHSIASMMYTVVITKGVSMPALPLGTTDAMAMYFEESPKHIRSPSSTNTTYSNTWDPTPDISWAATCF